METEEFLAKAQIFGALDNESLAQLADKVTLISFPEGPIVKEGDPGDALYIIKSGEAKVTKSAESGGAEVIITVLKPCDSFGEVAILDGLARTANVIATEDTECFRLSRDDFLAAIDEHPEIAKSMLLAFASMVRKSSELSTSLLNWVAG